MGGDKSGRGGKERAKDKEGGWEGGICLRNDDARERGMYEGT